MTGVFTSFKRLTLRRQIYIGFGLMCIFIISLGLGILGQLDGVRQFLASHQQINATADLQIDIYETVLKIQNRVLHYMHEGHLTAGEDAMERMDALLIRIEEALKEGQAEQDAAKLSQISEHLTLYQTTFEQAYAERQLCQQLVSVDLPKAVATLEEEILIYHKESQIEHSPDPALLHLQRSWSLLLRYFEFWESEFWLEAKREFKVMQDLSLKDGQQPAISGEVPKSLLAAMDAYDHISNRAVQATRGYLYLINVVMAGEVSEVFYLSGVMREQAVAKKIAARAEMAALIHRVSKWILWAVLAICLSGILSAIWISGKVTRPLSQIRDTFLELSRGGKIEKIPGHERSDEIGDLAHAADSFRQKNDQTNALLAKADALTRDLAAKQQLLEQSHNEMEQFVYTVSHDLKSPIVTSTGFIGIIKELAEKGDYEAALSKLDRVEKANQRMGVLINDLLELSRAGKVDRLYGSVDLNQVFIDLAEAWEIPLQEAGFSLSVENDLPTIHGDRSQVMQIFENLIGNSLKYGQAETAADNRIEIYSRPTEEEDGVCMVLRDHGAGIPEAYREKIFQLFSRMDNASAGTGIGLSIVRKLVRLHGGEIRAEDPPDAGQGACFVLHFKHTQPKEAHAT